MDRKKRAAKRSAKKKVLQSYEKRKTTKDTVCRYILYPVVPSTIGKSNDFYFHALRLIWNDRNILKDSQCKKMLQGLHLKKEEIDNLDVGKLARNKENGWFASSRQNDLATIGKVAGYFLGRFAHSVGSALDKRFVPGLIDAKNLNDIFEVLRDNHTIIPVIVKLNISPHSNFDYSKFLHITEDLVNVLHNGDKIAISRRTELLKINSSLHMRTWELLNSSEFETRQQIMDEIYSLDAGVQNDDVPIEALVPLIELTEGSLNTHRQNKHSEIERRPLSSRSKERNKKYPLHLYEME